MFNLITSLLGVLGIVAVSVLAPLTNAAAGVPNVAVIFTVYAAMNRDLFGALVTAFVLGVVGGVNLSEARGLYLLSLLVVVGVTRWGRRRFPLERRLMLAAWTAVACILGDIGLVLMGYLLLPGLRLEPTLVTVSPVVALVTAVLAVPVFTVLDWIEPLLRARQERSTFFS